MAKNKKQAAEENAKAPKGVPSSLEVDFKVTAKLPKDCGLSPLQAKVMKSVLEKQATESLELSFSHKDLEVEGTSVRIKSWAFMDLKPGPDPQRSLDLGGEGQ